MIDKNYNTKFRKFFSKFEEQYSKANHEEKSYLWDLAIDFVEKNRDFVMQYPIIQYWDNIDKNKYEEIETNFLKEYIEKEINLYFHIPFCKTRCSYCNFHIVVWDNNKDLLKKAYIKKLKKEVLFFIKKIDNFKIKTIFIWWWTPSYLNEIDLEDFLLFINKNLSKYYAKKIEFSFEWNPDSFNNKKLKILKNHWINRLSIWVQTFDKKIIKNINRHYDKKLVLKLIESAKSIGFDNINIDMIYGLPWHKYEIMKKDLDIVSKLDIEHITYYPLYYYDEAILSKIWKRENNIKEIYSFYDEVVKELKNNWLKQYWREYFCKNKISNYQNNFVSNWYLYWFWQSSYSFNQKYAFLKEQNLTNYIKNNNPLIKYINYNNEILDRRLLVLWSRNINILKNKIKNIEKLNKLNKLPLSLNLIKENKDWFKLTKTWLKYQEILAHMYI